jgi:hypothetical protein
MKFTELNKPVMTLGEAIQDIQKTVTVLCSSIEGYAVKNQCLDSSIIEILNTSHLAWEKLDYLNDFLFKQKCGLEKQEPVRKVKVLEGRNTPSRQGTEQLG